MNDVNPVTMILIPAFGATLAIVIWFVKRHLTRAEDAVDRLGAEIDEKGKDIKSEIKEELDLVRVSLAQGAVRADELIRGLKESVAVLDRQLERTMVRMQAVTDRLDGSSSETASVKNEVRELTRETADHRAKIRFLENEVERIGSVKWIKDPPPRKS